MTPETDVERSATQPAQERLHRVLWRYYQRKWNPNPDTVKTLRDWKDWPMLVRMPDLRTDYTVLIDGGYVLSVSRGMSREPKIMAFMLSETMVKVDNDITTAAIETVAGRIKIRGFEPDRRRLLAALSFLTW